MSWTVVSWRNLEEAQPESSQQEAVPEPRLQKYLRLLHVCDGIRISELTEHLPDFAIQLQIKINSRVGFCRTLIQSPLLKRSSHVLAKSLFQGFGLSSGAPCASLRLRRLEDVDGNVGIHMVQHAYL